MTGAPASSEPASEDRTRKGFVRRNLHFLIAVVILILTWTAVTLLGWVEKIPIPWPEGNEVNEEFRLVKGLPTKFGPFIREDRDGFIAELDGKPDGEIVFPDEIMSPLGIGQSVDQRRRPMRRSNWYLSRIYRDTRIRNMRSPYAYWRLAVFYYTGKRDVVPHVADVCQLASGAKQIGKERVTMNVPTAPDAWKQVAFQRGIFERKDPKTGIYRKSIVYYIFNLNGTPQNDRNRVRVGIAKPWVRYSYFAKIEVAPLGDLIEETGKVDQRTEEFLRSALPAVLKTLPTVEDIENLEAGTSKDK